MESFLRINPSDNVVVALRDLAQNEILKVDDRQVQLCENIKGGHKVAVCPIAKGENVVKYGWPIGHAARDIQTGEWVHIHNVETNLEGIESYTYNPERVRAGIPDEGRTFRGYKRVGGGVGVRNELWIIPTVGCVNGIADLIAKEFEKEADTQKIDAVLVLKHSFGCSQVGQDFINTKTILGDLVKHPNAGGVLVLGLGCEYNKMDDFIGFLGDYDAQRVRFLIAQEVPDEVEAGKGLLMELYENMLHDSREEIPFSELKIGLKCGGSDGYSGITANPLLGAFTDYVVGQGATAALTEVPEMFGAERILMNRCVDSSVFDKTVRLVNDYKDHFIKNGQAVYDNPSPGNKAGGITTLEDKSLGCTQKAGTAPVADVVLYGAKLMMKGLSLLESPSNDLVASTALAAAGCQIVLFTTGRGTPYGSPVPTVKISSNSRLYNLKKKWIDFNAGRLIEGEPMEEVLKDFISLIESVANGKHVNNELNESRELTIFKSGVTE